TAGAVGDLREKFIRTLDFVHKVFGTSAFHNVSPSNPDKLVSKVSSTVFDAIMVGSWLLIDNDQVTEDHDEAYREAKLHKLHDPEYQKILLQETMRSANIRRRINEMYESLRGA